MEDEWTKTGPKEQQQRSNGRQREKEEEEKEQKPLEGKRLKRKGQKQDGNRGRM